MENIIEMNPTLSFDSSKQDLLKWLLKRIKVKLIFYLLLEIVLFYKKIYIFFFIVYEKVKGQFDGNKLYAAELLSILVQNSDDNRKFLGELDGIDILLQQLAVIKIFFSSTLINK